MSELNYKTITLDSTQDKVKFVEYNPNNTSSQTSNDVFLIQDINGKPVFQRKKNITIEKNLIDAATGEKFDDIVSINATLHPYNSISKSVAVSNSYNLYAGEYITYNATIKSDKYPAYVFMDDENSQVLVNSYKQSASLTNLKNLTDSDFYPSPTSTGKLTFNVKYIAGYLITLIYDSSMVNVLVSGAEAYGTKQFKAQVNADVTLTIMPTDLSKYMIKDVKIDGDSITLIEGSYTISNITKNISVVIEAKNINPVAGTINILEPVSIFDQLDVSIRQSDLWDMPLESSNNGAYSWIIKPQMDSNNNRYPLPQYINFDPSCITAYEYRIEQHTFDEGTFMCGILNLSCAQDKNTDISFSIVPGTINASVSGLNNSIQGYDDPNADVVMAPDISKVSTIGSTSTCWTESVDDTSAKLYAQYSSAFSVIDNDSDIGYYDPDSANGENAYANNSNKLVMKMPSKTFISFPDSDTWLSSFNDAIPDKCSMTVECDNNTNTQCITFANDMTISDVISAGSYNATTNNKFIEFSRDNTTDIKTISYEYCENNNNLLALTFTDFVNNSEDYANTIDFYIARVSDSYQTLDTLDYDSLRKIPVLGCLKASLDQSCTVYFDREAFNSSGSNNILVYTSKIPEDQGDLSFVTVDNSTTPSSLSCSITDLANAGAGDFRPIRIYDKKCLGSHGNSVGVLFTFDTGNGANIHFSVSGVTVE